MVDTHKSRSVVKFYSLDSQRNLVLPGILQNSLCIELECGTTPAGRRRSSSILREVLMAHFPASLFMSRLAGSSGTQEVCEASKSRNRTGSVISKSGRSGLSQMPPAMTQRGLRHQSLLMLIASFPPSHPGNSARRQQGPRGPQRSEGRPSLTDWLNLCTVSSTEQETARAPTRELDGTSHRSQSSGTSVVVRAVTSVLAS